MEQYVEVFEKYGFTEQEMVSLIVQALGILDKDGLVELKGMPMKAYLNNRLEIVYKKSKRYPALEQAIKQFALA